MESMTASLQLPFLYERRSGEPLVETCNRWDACERRATKKKSSIGAAVLHSSSRRIRLQGNNEAVEENTDQLERGRREAQQAELLANFSTCSQGPVAAPWPTATFDESAAFLIFPSWRGISVASISTGKVLC
jgi:hypothetical protein